MKVHSVRTGIDVTHSRRRFARRATVAPVAVPVLTLLPARRKSCSINGSES